MRTFIIGEAGVNHNGSEDLAFKLVDIASAAGVDAVKFQTFKAKNIAIDGSEKAAYQKTATDAEESQLEMLERLELSYDFHRELAGYCHRQNIVFLSTAFDHESLDFLTRELQLGMLKLSSGEITNGPLILSHAQAKADLIVSTGMATLGEIEAALGIVAFGLTDGRTPSGKAFSAAYQSESGQQALREKVILLHCTTEYPAPLADIHLRAMQTMEKAFGLRVGYSDHSNGITVPLAATALGAVVIEKHFTLDKGLPGPDHAASLEPDELRAMVAGIREVEKVLGSRVKAPRPSEEPNRAIARKSIVATDRIRAGELLTTSNLGAKRAGAGISPMDYWDLIGTASDRDYAPGDKIQ